VLAAETEEGPAGAGEHRREQVMAGLVADQDQRHADHLL
jgi:hypothetical protein